MSAIGGKADIGAPRILQRKLASKALSSSRRSLL
jgi:hypothetical protein